MTLVNIKLEVVNYVGIATNLLTPPMPRHIQVNITLTDEQKAHVNGIPQKYLKEFQPLLLELKEVFLYVKAMGK